MNKNILLALIVWAIDVDGLSMPFIKAWEMFQRDAWGMYKTYTDPNDKLLYCPNLVGQNHLDMFTDYVLSYAKTYINSGLRDYGKYNNHILNYTKA